MTSDADADAEDDDDECCERQRAELEFVSAAYDPHTEAWHEVNATGDPVVHRTLTLRTADGLVVIPVTVSMTMPPTYPMSMEDPLRISATVTTRGDVVSSSTSAPHQARKAVINALPALIQTLQRVADEHIGTEAVLAVLAHADEWVANGEWEAAAAVAAEPSSTSTLSRQGGETMQASLFTDRSPDDNVIRIVFARRLIYSHHIISKVKRSDIMEWAAYYQLTGYMKIGWPGLFIIEGREEDCVEFYSLIRRWNWQYLVVRGEQREELLVTTTSDPQQQQETTKTVVQEHRVFQAFVEVEEMSIVAQHCRDVGLEALFRTSMKQYDSSGTSDSSVPSSSSLTHAARDVIPYGALVHVDHMNDPKGYRKWLQKTAMETGCQLLLKQAYPHDDYSQRPRIVVAIVADSSTNVSSFLKRWRTSRVDVDSRGKACLERMMTILVEGTLPHGVSIIKNIMGEDDSLTTTEGLLQEMLQSLGGDVWNDALATLLEYPN